MYGRMMLFMNEEVEIDNYTAQSSLYLLNFTNQFKNEDEITKRDKIISERGEFKILVSDNTIKDTIKENKFKNAFCKIIYNNYGKALYETKEIKNETKELLCDENSIDKELNTFFEFTDNENDTLTTNEINTIIEQCSIKVKKTTSKLFFESNGALEYKNNKTRGRTFIKSKTL
jgi:hypothetical protein